MPKLALRRPSQRPTHPLIWCAATICAVLAIAVVITGVVVFVGYMVIHPEVPQLSVTNANLDDIYFDQTSQLTVRVIIILRAENDNAKAHASFYEARFDLYFQGQKVAVLVAQPFDVSRNSTLELHYVVESGSIPLSDEESNVVELSFKQQSIKFDLKGHVRTRWRIGFLGSVRFWLRLDCQLDLPTNKTSIDPRCTTKSK